MYFARTMNFEFFRLFINEDKISCEVRIEKLNKKDNNRLYILATFLCKNQNEKQVLGGNFDGIILT